ncbi:MAG: flagellin [Caulobacterales bacterium]|nr:flagellin [Caulobacterales bacterium]
MSISVHTNKSAMVALANLNQTNSELDMTQNRINTGLKVSGAKDNSAVYAVAQNMRSDISALESVHTSLDRSISIADVALAAGEAISGLLVEMRAKATAAMDPSIDGFTRQAYDADFKALLDQVSVILQNAEFDGANLLDGSLTPGMEFLADAAGARTITLKTQNLTIGGPNLTIATTASLGTATLAANVASAIRTSLDNVNQSLANLGSDLKKMESHGTFVSRLRDTLDVGVGNLVDADLAVESARLQALQVRQQLGVQSLSIANSSPQVILSLFQG